MISLNKKLKNRIFIGSIASLVATVALSNIVIFTVFLIMVIIFCLIEIFSVINNKIKNTIICFGISLIFLFYVMMAAFSGFCLRIFSLPILLLIIMGTIVNDVTAYSVGKKFGEIKLAPRISPGKTLEGAIGGITAVLIFSCIYGYFILLLFYTEFSWLEFLSIGIIVAFAGIFGDLLESGFKRLFSVKDSGRLLGEHGGILDRIDSHMGAMIAVFIYFWYLGYFFSHP